MKKKKSLNLLLTLTTSLLIITVIMVVAGATSAIQVKPYPSFLLPVYIFACVPSILIAVYVLFCKFSNRWSTMNEKKQKSQVTFIVILGNFISVFLLLISILNGWHRMYWWEREWRSLYEVAQTTADERYEYQIDILNCFQFNSYARLRVRDISTNEEFMIFLDINIQEMIVFTGGGANSQWSSLTYSEEERCYLLETTTSLDLQRLYMFEIDMNARTSTIISETTVHRTNSGGIYGESGEVIHRYWVEVWQIYVDGERTDVEIWLRVNAIGRSSWPIYLPIDGTTILMATDNLHNFDENASTNERPVWVIAEATDVPGVLIVQTNEEFSTHTTLTFLVDIYAETAEEITIDELNQL